ncbi:MAG: integrase, partial [Planctomycetes bacterium]|nr:integrase [Planctomycetota bacterium]
MTEDQPRDLVVQKGDTRLLSREQFQRLADVPAVFVWLANIDNPNTRRAYESDVE